MRIMVVNTLYHPYKIGGAEISVQFLAEELIRKGHQVRVVCLHEHNYKKMDLVNGVEIVYLPIKNIYWPFDDKNKGKLRRLIWHVIDSYNFLMARLISKEINEFNPDVVHTNNIAGFSVSIWSAVKKKNKKLVHTSRDYYLFHPSSTMFLRNRNLEPTEVSVRFWSFIKKIASRKVDGYIGISDFIRAFHVDNGFFRRAVSSYIYNAVEKIKFKEENTNEIRFGFIGRLTKDKGFDIYCQLVNVFKERYPRATFIAAGRFIESEDGEELESLARDNGVKLLGFVQVNQFLSEVDIVVLPIKWREPFGRVVLESVLANKIVLTNSVGGITELERIFSKIHFMENMDSLDFTEKSNNELNGEMFSYSEIADKYIDFYKKILSIEPLS